MAMMRKLTNVWIIGNLLLCFAVSTHAQDIIRQRSCNSAGYQKQIDSVKLFYQTGGFRLLREASMEMESQYEMPVVVPLNGRDLYGFVFIGDPNSKLFEVRLYDFAEAQVYYEKKLAGDQQANVISFVYAPPASNYFVLKAVQVKKKQKILCGYVLLFKKEAGSKK